MAALFAIGDAELREETQDQSQQQQQQGLHAVFGSADLEDDFLSLENPQMTSLLLFSRLQPIEGGDTKQQQQQQQQLQLMPFAAALNEASVSSPVVPPLFPSLWDIFPLLLLLLLLSPLWGLCRFQGSLSRGPFVA